MGAPEDNPNATADPAGDAPIETSASVPDHAMAWWRRPWVEWVLLAATLLVFTESLNYGFVDPDDELFCVNNPAFHEPGLKGLGTVWHTVNVHEYMPVTYMTLWLDWKLWQGEMMWAMRLHALLWFFIGALGIRSFILRLTHRRDWAFIITLLYLLHPVSAHSVLWMAERKNLVSIAISFWCFDRYLAARAAATFREGAVNYGIAIVLAALALVSKPHATVIPVVLVFYEVLLGSGTWRRRILAWLPFLALSVIYVSSSYLWIHLRMQSHRFGGSMAGSLFNDGPILVRYLVNTVVPWKLTFWYAVDELGFNSVWGWCSWVIILGLLGLSVALVRPRPLMAFCWLGGAGIISCSLNIAAAQWTPMADQYHQWALPFLFLAACLILKFVLSPLPEMVRRRWAIIFTIWFACFFAFSTLTRIPEYRSPLALVGQNVKVQPRSSTAWGRMTRYLRAHEDPEERKKAGVAALRSLEGIDSYRLQEDARLTVAVEASVLLYRGFLWKGDKELKGRAEAVIAQQARILDVSALPYGDIARGSFYARTKRPGKAIETLKPHFTETLKRAARKLRESCREGTRLPHELPPSVATPTKLIGSDRIKVRAVWSELMLVLAEALRQEGRFEEAFDVAAVLSNYDPENARAKQLLAGVYRELKLDDAAQRLEQSMAN